MKTEPAPFASLSSGLLARKGHARPAMRPQAFTGGYASLAAGLDDLGWNDMGEATPPEADVHPLRSAPEPVHRQGVPAVLTQRHQLTAQFDSPPADMASETQMLGTGAIVEPEPFATIASRPVSVATARRLQRETRHKAKAAFTLRLDEDRHLRLRLAGALSGRSAQMLVTEALDAFFDSVPEVDDLARQVPMPEGKAGSRR